MIVVGNAGQEYHSACSHQTTVGAVNRTQMRVRVDLVQNVVDAAGCQSDVLIEHCLPGVLDDSTVHCGQAIHLMVCPDSEPKLPVFGSGQHGVRVKTVLGVDVAVNEDAYTREEVADGERAELVP